MGKNSLTTECSTHGILTSAFVPLLIRRTAISKPGTTCIHAYKCELHRYNQTFLTMNPVTLHIVPRLFPFLVGQKTAVQFLELLINFDDRYLPTNISPLSNSSNSSFSPSVSLNKKPTYCNFTFWNSINHRHVTGFA